MCAYTLEQLLGYRDTTCGESQSEPAFQKKSVVNLGIFSQASVLWTEIPYSCGREKDMSCAQVSPEALIMSPVLHEKIGESKNITIAVSVDSDNYYDKYSYVGVSFSNSAIGFRIISQNSGEVPVRKVKMLTLELGKEMEEKDILEHTADMVLFWEVIGVAEKINKDEWKKTDLICRTGSS